MLKVAQELLDSLTGSVENIGALGRGAPAVVTGQQVGLHLGPLYTIYKAATAVAIARAKSAVPVFWLQTEDHDFAEIASCSVMPGRVLQLPVDNARISIAQRRLPAEIDSLNESLGDLISDQPHASEVVSLFKDHYRQGNSFADAFRGVLARFFPDLVFLDPRQPAIARLAQPIFRRAIERAAEIERALLPGQVNLRPGFTLCFFHPDGPEGPRSRLEFGKFPDCDPMQLSTSALLRPLLQDHLLPTIVYIGGPAELAYFKQIEALYPLFDLQKPTILERAHFRLIPPFLRRALEQLKLTPGEIEARELLPPHSPDAPNSSWLVELDARLDLLPQDRDVARARRSIHYHMDRLERRYRRAAAERDSVFSERANKLKSWLPKQERIFGVAWFAAHSGIDALVDGIFAHLDGSTMKDIYL
jgi:uncharacterized protein YllA (UPF0747 family)